MRRVTNRVNKVSINSVNYFNKNGTVKMKPGLLEENELFIIINDEKMIDYDIVNKVFIMNNDDIAVCISEDLSLYVKSDNEIKDNNISLEYNSDIFMIGDDRDVYTK